MPRSPAPLRSRQSRTARTRERYRRPRSALTDGELLTYFFRDTAPGNGHPGGGAARPPVCCHLHLAGALGGACVHPHRREHGYALCSTTTCNSIGLPQLRANPASGSHPRSHRLRIFSRSNTATGLAAPRLPTRAGAARPAGSTGACPPHRAAVRGLCVPRAPRLRAGTAAAPSPSHRPSDRPRWPRGTAAASRR